MDPRTSPREAGGSRTLLAAMMARSSMSPSVVRAFGRSRADPPDWMRSTSGSSAALKSQIRVLCRGPTLLQLGRSGEQHRAMARTSSMKSRGHVHPWAGEPGGIRLSRREMRSGSHRGNAVMQSSRLAGSAHACRVQGPFAAIRMSVRAGRRACLVPGAGLPAGCLGELPGVIGKVPLLAGNCAEAP